MTPQEKNHQQVDAMLAASGWFFQVEEWSNLSAAWSVAGVERWLSMVEGLEGVVLADLWPDVQLRQCISQKLLPGNFYDDK